MTRHSPAHTGRCSSPRGMMKNSLGASTTSRSRQRYGQAALQHPEQLVLVVVLVPFELALEPHELHQLAVELAHHARLPEPVDVRELLGRADLARPRLFGPADEVQRALVGQNHAGLHLALRDVPVGAQECFLFPGRGQGEAVLPVEAHGPGGRGPGAHEHRALGQGHEVVEQRAADALAAIRSAYVGVADERHLAGNGAGRAVHVLQAHDADGLAVHFRTPEVHAGPRSRCAVRKAACTARASGPPG